MILKFLADTGSVFNIRQKLWTYLPPPAEKKVVIVLAALVMDKKEMKTPLTAKNW